MYVNELSTYILKRSSNSMENIKACKDCKYFSQGFIGEYCSKNSKITSFEIYDFKNGVIKKNIYNNKCRIEHMRDSILPWRCGRKAKYFEQKTFEPK